MTAPATCATCRWWHEKDHCRRFPPATVVYEMFQYEKDEYTAKKFMSRWPETDPDDYCGEHTTKEEA